MSESQDSDRHEAELNQHSSESIAFKEHYQCSDAFYAVLRQAAIEHLREERSHEHIDLEKVQLRRFTFEDGVIGFDATHPRVTHEDELEGDLDV